MTESYIRELIFGSNTHSRVQANLDTNLSIHHVVQYTTHTYLKAAAAG